MNPSTFTELNRRKFLKRGTVGAVAIGFGVGLLPTVARAAAKRIPVGVQLYSVREQFKTDVPGTLKAVAAIGYKGVEFAGYQGRSAKELRQMLDDNGLVACGTHTPYESVLGDKLKETVEFNQTLGNKFLIVPWMTAKSKAEWLDKAKLFNEIGDKVKPDGMFIGYHAHAHDFEKFDGESAWDIFFGSTRPEVIMQLDTCNCHQGGAEPVAVLKKYPGRAKTIHIKPFGGGPEAVIGGDKVDWAGVFEFCEGPGGTQWYVVEHETSKQPLETLKRSYAAMQKLGKV